MSGQKWHSKIQKQTKKSKPKNYKQKKVRLIHQKRKTKNMKLNIKNSTKKLIAKGTLSQKTSKNLLKKDPKNG